MTSVVNRAVPELSSGDGEEECTDCAESSLDVLYLRGSAQLVKLMPITDFNAINMTDSPHLQSISCLEVR